MSDFVYTALFGNYENLNEIYVKKKDSTNYICFTDNSNLRSDTWEIKYVEPDLINGPIRQSRWIKMLGHKHFPRGSRVLYMDNSVQLKADGFEILNEWLSDSSLCFMQHYVRKTVRNEFFICSAYGLDDQQKIFEQFNYYKQLYPHILSEKPFWGGLIAKVNSEITNKFMEIWSEEYSRYSKRDQLSINVSQFISGVRIKSLVGSNSDSKWHSWPLNLNRNIEMRDPYANSPTRKLKIIKNAMTHGLKFYY